MPVSKVETQVTWAAANTKTLNTNNWVVSDEVTLNDSDWSALVYIRADNSGTPADGDTVELRLLPTAGDVDNGGGADDYPDVNTSGATAAQSMFLAMLDTYGAYDPDTCPVVLDSLPFSKFKIAARAAQGATRNIVLSVRVKTHRGAIA